VHVRSKVVMNQSGSKVMMSQLDTKMIKEPDTYNIIEEFCYRIIETLKEWYHNLGNVRQN